MYKLNIINKQGCILESKERQNYTKTSLKEIFKSYENPNSIHIDVCEVNPETETIDLEATYYWNEVKSCGYRGFAIDNLQSLPTRQTRLYSSYKDAHDAASKLGKKHFSEGRYSVDVQLL